MSKQVREYMERTKEVVPTRGTVHDLGRAITHKRIIIRLYLEGTSPPRSQGGQNTQRMPVTGTSELLIRPACSQIGI